MTGWPPPAIGDPYATINAVRRRPWCVRQDSPDPGRVGSFSACADREEASDLVLLIHRRRLEAPFRCALQFGPSRML